MMAIALNFPYHRSRLNRPTFFPAMDRDFLGMVQGLVLKAIWPDRRKVRNGELVA